MAGQINLYELIGRINWIFLFRHPEKEMELPE